jgi:hypothetical protein
LRLPESYTPVEFVSFFSDKEAADEQVATLTSGNLELAPEKVRWGWEHEVISHHIVELSPGMDVDRIYANAGVSMEQAAH